MSSTAGCLCAVRDAVCLISGIILMFFYIKIKLRHSSHELILVKL